MRLHSLKTLGEKPIAIGKVQKNLEKILRNYMHECFVWLPAVRSLVVTSPSYQEIHGRSSMVIAAMCKDLLYHELLRINLNRVEDEGSQIVNMSSDLFASN